MLKTKTWVLIFSVFLLCSAAAAVIMWHTMPHGTTVEILQDGKLIETIDLSQVQEPYSFVVEDPHGGSNTILVEPGRICVSHADCPDQVCVRHGWLSDGAAPIVCLPHRLVIQAVNPGSLDAVSQ